MLTGAGVGAEADTEVDGDPEEGTVGEPDATSGTRLITRVLTTRLGAAATEATFGFGPSAGSAPRAICQEIKPPRARAAALASTATLAVSVLVDGRLGR